MRVAIPSSSELITGDNFYTTTPWYTFFQNVYKAISGNLDISLSGTLEVDTDSASNTSTGATDLITYSLDANSLLNIGSMIKIHAWGTYAANGNNKTVTLAFGSQTILTTGVVAANAGSWSIKATIIRKTSTTQEIITEIISSNSSVVDSATRTAGTQDLTTALTIKCVGTGGATNDIIQYGMTIELSPSI